MWDCWNCLLDHDNNYTTLPCTRQGNHGLLTVGSETRFDVDVGEFVPRRIDEEGKDTWNLNSTSIAGRHLHHAVRECRLVSHQSLKPLTNFPALPLSTWA